MDKRYLKIYSSQNDYENNWLNDLEEPHVVLLSDNETVIYKSKEEKEIDYSTQYFTLEAIEDTEFSFTIGTGLELPFENDICFYSVDDCQTWNELAENTATPTIKQGEKISFKGTYKNDTSSSCKFTSTSKFNVYGNAMSLIYGDDFIGQTNLEGKDYCFDSLFFQNTNLLSAENLILPATTLAERCYNMMFYGCTSLTTAPELPATTLAISCYIQMFSNCTSLTTAPELPATTLASSCYQGMFYNCTSLTIAPELLATTLAEWCYIYMFQGCTSLTTAPELPATTLAISCYSSMFQGCTSLTTAPELPATTLSNNCYQGMFYKCTELTTAPELPATTLAIGCYQSMFYNCTSLTTAPELLATTLTSDCYDYMFNGCSKLNYIKALFTTKPSITYTFNWVNGVASNGTFVKNANATWDVTGNNGIPNGWTVETA